MKYKLSGKIMKNFFGIRAKTYSLFIDDSSENKKTKGTKKCVIKKILNLKNIKTVQKQISQRIKLAQIVLKKSLKISKRQINIENIAKI